MTCVWLMFLLPVVTVQRVSPLPACPASCVLCSEDAVICQRLAHFIDAARSTQALLLTEGSISTVQPASFSNLTNITVLGLSDNKISELSGEAFRRLPFLQTLLLDHNFLTSQTLQGGVLTNLTHLEVLALGHNFINMVQAGWFKGTKALLILKLEGNLLTTLDSGSFPLNDFRYLESLDLSDNLLQQLDRFSFRGLVSLKTLDLSRNRLHSAPAEAFSYLTWLTNLNLDLNLWNCSCELVDLAAVLSSFIQQPDKTLYNGRRMVCVSTDNPAVTTVLELTEANCVPSNQNITLKIDTKGGVTPQVYAQNLAITAVICFIGGVGLTLLVVLIYHQVSQRKAGKERRRLEEEGDKSSPVANHVNHRDAQERTRDALSYADSSELWNKDSSKLDGRTDRRGGRSQSRTNGQIPVRKGNWMNGGIRAEEDKERRRVRLMMDEERSRTAFQQQNSNRDAPNKFYPHNTNSSSHPLREMTETWPSHRADRNMDDYRTDMEANIRGNENLLCRSCLGMFPAPEQDEVQALNGRGRNGRFETAANTEFKRDTRNVKFDLQSLRTRQEEESLQDEAAALGHKAPSSRSLKVKLNLNPLRKTKVHPGRKSKISENERRKQKKRHRKDREEEDGEEKCERNFKSSREKRRKSSSTGRGEEKEKQQEGDKSKDAKMKKAASKGEQEGQQGSEGKPEENQNPVSSGPAEGSTPVTQSLQVPVQYHTAGLRRGSAQAFPFFPADRNFSLLGSAGSQLTGSSLSLQGGSALPFTSGPNPLLPGANPPGGGLSGPNAAPRGSTESFSRPAAGGIVSSVPLLMSQELNLSLANPAANPVLLSQNQLPSESSAPGTFLKPDPAGQRLQTGDGLLQLLPKPQTAPVTDSIPDQGQDGSGATSRAPELETTVDNMSNSQTETRPVPAGSTTNLPPGAAPLTEGAAGVDVSALESDSPPEAALLQQEFLSEEEGSSPRRRLKLTIPEKTSSRPPTALERKIR